MDKHSIRILLADDDEDVLESLKSLLCAEDDITVVGQSVNGPDAVRRAQDLNPDLAILDITMPLMNGIQATRRLRELLPSIRILILSGHTTPSYVGSALQAGADGYLIKTAAGRELVDAIRSVLAGHGYVSESLRISC